VLGSPLFERTTVHLENGEHIVIDARDNSAGNVYISKMRINGKEYTHNFLTHDALTKGATIKLLMSNTPNRSRGTKADDAPYSFSKNSE
jgi:putative alpha-1,2-mannosidase